MERRKGACAKCGKPPYARIRHSGTNMEVNVCVDCLPNVQAILMDQGGSGNTEQPVVNRDYQSPSGRLWAWCDIWKCWQFEDHAFKIYAIDGGYVCASHDVWHDGRFSTFGESEREVCRETDDRDSLEEFRLWCELRAKKINETPRPQMCESNQMSFDKLVLIIREIEKYQRQST